MRRFIFKSAILPTLVAVLAGVLAFGCGPVDVEVPEVNGTSSELVRLGHDALNDRNWDNAVYYYEEAYNRDNNNAEAIVYSSLAKLAQISVDPRVADLLRNRLGFQNYPNRLNALFSTDWMSNYQEKYVIYSYWDEGTSRYVRWFDEYDISYWSYEGVDRVGYYYENYECDGSYYGCNMTYRFVTAAPKYEVYDNYVPGLVTPSWIKGGNDPNTMYNRSLVDGIPSIETWSILLLANIVDKNTDGLNRFMDELISAVFGSGSLFEQARSRIDRLKSTGERVNVARSFIEATDLEDMFDEFDKIGWAELNAVISFMTGIKAGLEWIAAYDLNTNLNFLKNAWKADDAYFIERLKTVNANDLPFNNNFLKSRDVGKMDAARRDFKAAIIGLDESYANILSSDLYTTVVKDAYSTLHDGASKLIDAVENGGVFWIKEEPENGSWPVSAGHGVVGGVDMGKFFQPGYFSLQNLFETENGGKPVFYIRYRTDRYVTDCWFDYWDGVEYCGDYYDGYDTEYERITPENYRQKFSEAETFGHDILFKLRMSTITGIVRNGDGSPVEIDNEYGPQFPPDIAKVLYEKYNGLPLSKSRFDRPLALSKKR
ncbi:MAG: hypothetical protein LBB74_09715 [Chitinispirillales bacterium]|jgi:hypothetical protein|nr:hypothetical protein [Chitinispirillales bacterium]